jgi:hypothetical protein
LSIFIYYIDERNIKNVASESNFFCYDHKGSLKIKKTPNFSGVICESNSQLSIQNHNSTVGDEVKWETAFEKRLGNFNDLL